MTANDPLGLATLFEGGGEPWLPLLKPVIEQQPDAETFIGPTREKAIVPVRELTFQALKPNPPARWRVVVFGQNPFLYTTESVLYKQLKATLRDSDRKKALPWFPYLRLFLSAVSKLERQETSLYRGVSKDLRKEYPKDRVVTWWGVSSCTPSLAVAKSFLGSSGRRTLFELRPRSAVSIMGYSAFTGEQEYVLPPGTRLRVDDVTMERDLCRVVLGEVEGPRLVG